MFGYSRFIIRAAAPATLVRESFRRQSTFSISSISATAAATLLASTTKNNNEASSSIGTAEPSVSCKNGANSGVRISCCGFSKNLIGGPSLVKEKDVYGDDACFIASYKSTHVAGKIFLLILNTCKFCLFCRRGGWRWRMEKIRN